MRLGCIGCVVCLALLAGLGFAIIGTGWAIAQILQDPGIVVPPTNPADGVRAQQKIFELVRRGGRSPRGAADEPVILSEGEVNALLARHLAPDIVPFESPFVRLLGDEELEFAGRLPLRRVLGEPPLSVIGGALPERWASHPVWLRARARVSVERDGRRYLRVDVEEFALGRQRLPVVLVRVLLDPASLRLLGMPLPQSVERASIERGRVVIRTAS